MDIITNILEDIKSNRDNWRKQPFEDSLYHIDREIAIERCTFKGEEYISINRRHYKVTQEDSDNLKALIESFYPKTIEDFPLRTK